MTSFSKELDSRPRQRREEVGPRRPDCAREGCANDAGVRDPWFVHASQSRDAAKGYAGDCAACAMRGRVCVGYVTPKQALTEDEPPIPDEPTPASIAADGAGQWSESHAPTSPPNFKADSHPNPQLTDGTASCFMHGDFDPRLADCPSCTHRTAAEIAARLK